MSDTQRLERNMDMGERAVKILWALIAASFCLGGWVTAIQLQVSGNTSALAQERSDRKDADNQIQADRAKALENWNNWRERVTGDLGEIKALLMKDRQK